MCTLSMVIVHSHCMYFMKTKDILVIHIFMYCMIVMFGDGSFIHSQDSNSISRLPICLRFFIVKIRAISPIPMFVCNNDKWDYWIATCSSFDCSYIPLWTFLYKDALMPTENNVNKERRVNVRLEKHKRMNKEIQVCPTSLFFFSIKNMLHWY